MQIVGYSDRLSAQPGDTLKFMVSCELPAYRADIVRLIHGNTDPNGPGFKEELIPSPVSGEHPGRKQAIHSGSHVIVPDSPVLRITDSFTIQGWIYPTTPGKAVQGIVTKWREGHTGGYGLFLDGAGRLGLWLGDRSGAVERLHTGIPLRASQWYFVAGVFDADKRRVRLYQQPDTIWPDDSHAVRDRAASTCSLGVNDAPLLMAGHWARDDSATDFVGGHFNGKIDGPCLFSRVLDPEEIGALRRGAPKSGSDNALIASWEFDRGVSSDRILDPSPNQLDARAVNMPTRAVTGHNWTGTVLDFKSAPHEYGAIHFHDDDLEDAGWEEDFSFAIPEEMRSGVYAASHLLRASEQAGGEDYVPFFVTPKRGAPSADILFLAPTASYLAYANFHIMADPSHKERWSRITKKEFPPEYPIHPADKYMVDQKLSSLYDRHTDGSGVCYSSRLRPILNMRPKYTMQISEDSQGDPHQFNADLHLLDWMETKGFEFDVVTDEDLHLEGADLLNPYRVVVTGSHPEYWSGQMLNALEAYLASGGRLMYMGGNGFYWVTSFDSEHPHVIEVRRWGGIRTWEASPGEYHHSTTGETGGLWRYRGSPPQRLVGVGFTAQGFAGSAPYRRQPGSFDPRAAFIFEGIGEDESIGDFGLVMGGAGGDEVDRADVAVGTPPHALVLASATGFSDLYQHVIEEVLISDSSQGGTVNPLVRADMVYFEGPKGGAVFSVGSISWCGEPIPR